MIAIAKMKNYYIVGVVKPYNESWVCLENASKSITKLTDYVQNLEFVGNVKVRTNRLIPCNASWNKYLDQIFPFPAGIFFFLRRYGYESKIVPMTAITEKMIKDQVWAILWDYLEENHETF